MKQNIFGTTLGKLVHMQAKRFVKRMSKKEFETLQFAVKHKEQIHNATMLFVRMNKQRITEQVIEFVEDLNEKSKNAKG